MIKSATLTFQRFYHDSGRAILIGYNNNKYWIPKKLCRNLVINKKLAGHVSIPTFKYEEITGKQPTVEIANYIIEKHVPVKIESKNTIPDADLIR
jgi:hypothetical protein